MECLGHRTKRRNDRKNLLRPGEVMTAARVGAFGRKKGRGGWGRRGRDSIKMWGSVCVCVGGGGGG